jgi:hypothetical protein
MTSGGKIVLALVLLSSEYFWQAINPRESTKAARARDTIDFFTG